MRTILICASAAALLALSACDGGEANGSGQNTAAWAEASNVPPPPGPTGNLSSPAAGAIPANAMFLVGRWGREPGCGRPVEFRADGAMINHRGDVGSWSAEGSPPVVTLNIPVGAIRGTLVQTPQGAEVRGGPGQVLTFYRCDAASAGQPGGGDMAVPAPPPPPGGAAAGPAAGAPRQVSGSITDADFPASAIRAQAQGTTRVRLQIGENGRVTGCSVIASSGNAALDSTTCSLMQRRFRFEPAMGNGGPVASQTERSMSWRLPGD